MQKSKGICVFLIKVTGKRPLETEENGGDHGEETTGKDIPTLGIKSYK